MFIEEKGGTIAASDETFETLWSDGRKAVFGSRLGFRFGSVAFW